MITPTWRLTEPPAHLTHAPTIEYLTEVGFPLVDLDDYLSSTHLPERGLWEADADELFGRRVGDAPPTVFCYGVATFYGEYTLMIDGATGGVDVYDPSGWDHGEGYTGHAFDTVAELAAVVEVLKEHQDDPDALKAAAVERGGEKSAYWQLIFDYLDV